jgi:hypothetical protein
MMGWGDALFELDYNVRKIEAELQHDRLVQIALGTASRPEKESRGRRLARQMGDLMAGFWCWWERRLATEAGAAAC